MNYEPDHTIFIDERPVTRICHLHWVNDLSANIDVILPAINRLLRMNHET